MKVKRKQSIIKFSTLILLALLLIFISIFTQLRKKLTFMKNTEERIEYTYRNHTIIKTNEYYYDGQPFQVIVELQLMYDHSNPVELMASISLVYLLNKALRLTNIHYSFDNVQYQIVDFDSGETSANFYDDLRSLNIEFKSKIHSRNSGYTVKMRLTPNDKSQAQFSDLMYQGNTRWLFDVKAGIKSINEQTIPIEFTSS